MDELIYNAKESRLVMFLCRLNNLLLLSFKHRVPNVTIATDLICGFPTETPDDFQKTMDLVDKYRFPSLFINQFYPRPGTPAARMKRLPTEEVKRDT